MINSRNENPQIKSHANVQPEIVNLYRMVYCSQMTTMGILSIPTLKKIYEQSLSNNINNDMTGLLCYSNGYFFQYVEGSEQALTDFKNKLMKDSRHQNMKMLDFSMIPSRHFSNWTMKEIAIDKWATHNQAVSRILPFNPMNWTDKQFDYFVTMLKERYTKELEIPQEDIQDKYLLASPMRPITNSLGLGVSNMVNRHQAFLFLLVVFSILMTLAIVMMLVVSKT